MVRKPIFGDNSVGLGFNNHFPGVLSFELDRGVPLEPQNPYPSLRMILAERVPNYKDFS